ncbi:MAG TPA: peroxiredoxin [Polyangiaceae bacterium]|jgi:peroxiredoxin Q/BCP
MTLSVGTAAPDFEATSSDGRTVSLTELRGKKNVVLYFYPADFTVVCTRETCGFRDMYEDLASKDTEVVGVSFDDDASHERFRKEHDVPFPLVSDTGKALAQKYEASSMMSKLIGKAARVTYVIDKTGKIAGVFKAELSAKTHVEGVRDLLARLG